MFCLSAHATEIVSHDVITFSRHTDGYWQIWTASPDGSNLRQVTTSLRDKRYPLWVPGSDSILFHTNNNRIYEVDHLTGEETPILSDLGHIADPAISPDGHRLIFTRFDENVKDTSHLWGYEFESQKSQVLTHEAGLQYSPHFSPDGKTIAYVAGQGWGTHEIWVMDLETHNKTRLTENESYDLMPEYSPDGKSIAYASNFMGNYDIWLMDSDGKNQRKITKPLGIEANPAWSSDGKHLAIASQRGGNLQIWIIDLEGKNWRQVTSGEDESREPSWRRE